MAARVVDEHLPHRAPRDVQEVHAIDPGDAGLIDELEPRVVNQLGGLEGVARTLAPHQRAGNAPQLVVGGREQRFPGCRRPGSAVREEVRQVGRRQIVHGGGTW